MNNEVNPDNVFKPKKTPLMIGAVLLVLIVAIIVLSVFLLSRGDGTGKDTTNSSTPAPYSDPVLSGDPGTTPDSTDNGTDVPGSTSGDIPSTDPSGSGNPTTPQPPSPTSPSVTTSDKKYDKADPTTFSQTMNAESVGRGGQILVDETHAYTFPMDKLISRSAMASLSTSALKSEYDFVKVPGSSYYLLKNNNLFLNTEACVEFVNMMNAFAAATGNTDVQLRNAYYYDKDEQVCYNSTGLCVDLEINTGNGIYPLNYETLRADYYDWFIANSYRYGFVHMWENQSSTGHDEYSSFRYVGIPHATYMHNNDMDLESYLNKIKAYTIENVLTYTDDDGIAWQIYYVPKDSSGTTQISLTATPDSYTISGNNTDGYIVTINTAYFNR